jgi:uncharacterized protein involved in outer membrane biogenesis
MSSGQTTERSQLFAQRLALLVKASGFLLGMLVTGVMTLTLFLRLSFDDAQIETELGDMAQSLYQRELQFDDGLKLDLWPWPSLHCSAGSLSEADSKDNFARWQRADFELDLLALLRHRLVLRHAQIDGLQLRLQRDAQGDWNISDLLVQASRRFAVNLEGLHLQEASLSLADVGSGHTLSLQHLTLKAGALQSNHSGRLLLNAELLPSSPPLPAGQLQLESRYAFGEDFASGKLQDLRLSYSETKGSAQDKASTGSLQIPALQWRDGHWQAPSLHLNASLARQGEANLDLSELGDDANGISAGVEAALRWRSSAQQGIQTKLQGRLLYQPRDKLLTLEHGSGSLALQHPAINGGGLNAQLQTQAQWRLAADEGEERLNSSTQIDFGAPGSLQLKTRVLKRKTPTISAQLGSLQLDVDALLKRDMLASLLSDAKSLPDLNLDAQLQVTQLHLGGLHLSSVVVPLKLAAGKLSLPDHALQAYGGRLNGSLSWDSKSGELQSYEALREVQLSDLARDGGFTLPLAGIGNATLDIRSRGDQLSSLREQASGVLRVYVRDARWRGFDLERVLPTLQAGQMLAARAEQNTPLGEITGSFKVAEGALQVERLSTHSEGVDMSLQGKIQLRDGQLDLSAKLRPGGNKQLAALPAQKLALQLSGRLPQASLALQATSLKPR